jgi:hypothetical protein
MNKLFKLSGFIVAIYYKIKTWNRKRLLLRKLNKMQDKSSKEIIRVNISLHNFENNFNTYSDVFMNRINIFGRWQMKIMHNHISETKKNYDDFIKNELESTITNLYDSKYFIAQKNKELSNDMNNIFNGVICNNTKQKENIINESINLELLDEIFNCHQHLNDNISKLSNEIETSYDFEMDQEKKINYILTKLEKLNYLKKQNYHISDNLSIKKTQYIYTLS